MDHFLNIRLRPDPEFLPHQLMEALFAKLHRILAVQQRQDIGISFPGIQVQPSNLGLVLRLHGKAIALKDLMDAAWLGGMVQMTEISPILPTPADAVHRRVIREQAKSSAERLRRRLIKRKQITAEEALKRIPDSVCERLSLPFLEINSGSTGQRFRLFLRQGSIETTAVSGHFNAYGLSQSATIPWF